MCSIGDGIFDKIGNAEIIKQAWIAAKKNYKQKDQPVHQICGNIVESVMKDSIAYKTLDNITVVLLAFGNLKTALSEEFTKTYSNKENGDGSHHSSKDDAERGGSVDEDRNKDICQALNDYNGIIHNPDSSNGGLQYADNKEVFNYTKEDIQRVLNLPNTDLNIKDVQTMVKKPIMQVQPQIKAMQTHLSSQKQQALTSGRLNNPAEESKDAGGLQPSPMKNSSKRGFNVRNEDTSSTENSKDSEDRVAKSYNGTRNLGGL